MDVVRYNPTTWVADELIQGYNSCIWTERYQDAGEFELRTAKIDTTRALIPEGSYIGLRDSQEIMSVETYNIDGPEAVIKGRTFESILETRTTVALKPTAGASAMWTYGAEDIWPTDAAKALIMSHLTVSTEAPLQKVPNTSVENLIATHTGEQLSYAHEAKTLYQEILDLLQMESAGIRNQLRVDGKLLLYIYKGLDRTVNQTVNQPVIFRLDANHILDPKYLFSVKDYRNVAYVVSDNWQQIVYAPGVSATVSGLNRRILLVETSDIVAADTTTKKTKQATAIGLAALAKHNQTVFFDGEVSPVSPYIRGVDYNLGDKVTLMAKYGVSQTMLVNEFVRTEDQEGERAYPTLVVPGEE